MGFVIKNPKMGYVAVAGSGSYGSKFNWQLEHAKIFVDLSAVNKYFGARLGCIKKWTSQAEKQTTVSELMGYQISEVRIVVPDRPASATPSSMKAFEKVLLERLENI